MNASPVPSTRMGAGYDRFRTPVKRLGQTRMEWALLAMIAVVCAGLSLLQYRWTGELSRAELERLRAGLNERVQRIAHIFDENVRQCMALLPDPRQLREEGVAKAHLARYEEWTSSHDPSLFAKIAVASPEQGVLRLYGLVPDRGFVPMDWPPEWMRFREAMTARINGTGLPPSTPPDSDLIQIPVFAEGGEHREEGGDRRRNAPELEWMIFQVNENYLRTQLMPHLVSEYLNNGAEGVYDLSISRSPASDSVVYSTRSDGASVSHGADITMGVFSIDSAGGPGRRRGRGREGGPQGRWTLSVRDRAGSLEAAVASARFRDLATSLVLIGLLGGAAWALVRFTARSRRLSEMQFRFAAGVSHDLRTPLTAIRGAAFNLVDGVVKDPAAVGNYAKLILRNAEELTSMIENVLAFSASLRADTPHSSETFSAGDLIEHAAASMAQELEQAGCRIEVNVAPGLPVLEGDPGALELAFRNLIGNAIRHGSDGRWIGVSAERYDSGVEVRVSDRGPGIPESERQRIFEPFYRGEQTRAQRIQGTGLGLSLVKTTVERHRGTVAVENSPGGGAQFTLRLPAAPEAA